MIECARGETAPVLVDLQPLGFDTEGNVAFMAVK
jgi:hypothetical protein